KVQRAAMDRERLAQKGGACAIERERADEDRGARLALGSAEKASYRVAGDLGGRDGKAAMGARRDQADIVGDENNIGGRIEEIGWLALLKAVCRWRRIAARGRSLSGGGMHGRARGWREI